VSVEFTKATANKPHSIKLYEEAKKYNPSWPSDINKVIVGVASSPIVGHYFEYIKAFPKGKDPDTGIETITNKPAWLRSKVMSAPLSTPDKNPENKDSSEKPRLVFYIKAITSFGELRYHLRLNSKALVFKQAEIDLYGVVKNPFNKELYHIF
jgi:hypothetical protein